MDDVRIASRPWPRGISSAAVVAEAITDLRLHPEDCLGVLPVERNGRVLLVAHRRANRERAGEVAFHTLRWPAADRRVGPATVAEALQALAVAPEDVYGFFPGRWDSHQWRDLLVACRPGGTAAGVVRVEARPWPRGRRLRATREVVETHARAVLDGVAPERCFGLGTDSRSDHLLLAYAR